MSSNLTGTVAAASLILEDPHLPETICRVKQLSAIEGGKLVVPCTVIPTSYRPGKGIGLRHLMVPMRGYVKARQKPALSVLAVVGVVGGLVGIGYYLGRKRRR